MSTRPRPERAGIAEELRVVVVGGGYIGLYTALRLQRKLRRDGATITVVDERPTMTDQPFLPEVAAGSIEPRHIVVPLRHVLKHCRVVTARVAAIDHHRRKVTVVTPDGAASDIAYDVIVIGLGSVSLPPPVPGLADVAFGFKQIDEAITLRNHVLERLDFASSTIDHAARQRALTFVVVGGGCAGVEALAALEDMAHDACRDHRGVDPAEMRWVLAEASDRILPEVSRRLGAYALRQLRERGVEVLLGTRLDSADGGRVVLSDGQSFDAGTIVCTAGVRANPILANTDLPHDGAGRIIAAPTLAVVGTTNAWTAGDGAAVPDLTAPGTLCSPSAQHAIRQARVLADNIVRAHDRRALKTYRHRHAGSVASLGHHQGAAQIYGIPLRGIAAWFVHRAYHLSMMPTLDRKARILSDWALATLLRRDTTSLGRPHERIHHHVATSQFRPLALLAGTRDAVVDDENPRRPDDVRELIRTIRTPAR